MTVSFDEKMQKSVNQVGGVGFLSRNEVDRGFVGIIGRPGAAGFWTTCRQTVRLLVNCAIINRSLYTHLSYTTICGLMLQ